jgi:hypothetical protein
MFLYSYVATFDQLVLKIGDAFDIVIGNQGNAQRIQKMNCL